MKTNNTIINSIKNNVVKYLCAVVMMLSMSVNAWGWTITLHKGIGGYTTTSHTGGVALPDADDVGEFEFMDVWMKSPVVSTDDYWTGYNYYDKGATNFTEADGDLYALYYYYNSSTTEYFYTTYPAGASRTISFSVGYGSAPSNLTGSSITLPAIPAICSTASEAGWLPYGWATAAVANNSSSATIVGKPGDTYYPDANRTLYAVYINPGTTLSSSTIFTRVSSGGNKVDPSYENMPTSGYIIMTQATNPWTAISNTLRLNGVSNYFVRFAGQSPDYDPPTYNSTYNTMTTDSATLVWEIASPSTGVFTFRNIVTGKYLGLSSTTSAAFYDNASSDNAKWEVDGTTTDGYYLKNKAIEYYLTNTNVSSSPFGWRGAASKDGSKSNIHIWRQTTVTASGDKYQSSLPLCGYQVTYNGNGKNGGGNPPTDNTVYTSGATVTVLGNSNSMTKTGYTFSGWNTSPAGTGTNYTAGSGTFSITSDVTLYAKWVAKEYTVNLDKEGGSGGSTSVTATYDAAMPSAGAAPTLSGYTFGGYYGSVAGGGTQYYDATPSSAHTWNVDTDPSTIYAKWTQVVTLDKNTGSSDGSVTVTLHGSGTSSFTPATKTGYNCTGYFDATSDGHEVISNAGALKTYSSDISSYINSSGKWAHSGATTLYAQWEAKTYTVSFNQNGGSGGSSSVTATYGSAMPDADMPSTPPTGSTFAGYYYGETQYYDKDGVSAHVWDIAEDVTLTARWTTSTPTLAVASVGGDNVTITATPASSDAITEGNSASVAYDKTITLNYSSLSSDYHWVGWNVYETSTGNAVTVSGAGDGATFSMPDYNVTVSAIIYKKANIKAWCPVINLELSSGSTPILVTSVGGQSVKATRTLHLTVSGAATPAAVVTISGTGLEFYDGTTKITSENLTCSSYALDKTITVAYAPSTYVDENWVAPDITVSCSGTDIIKSNLVNARCLPNNGTSSGNGFVIAAKVGDEWFALPAAMSVGAQDGLPITVDDDEDPTEATQAPTSARYNLYNVYKSIGSNDRHKEYGTYAYLAGSGSKALKAAPSGVNLSLGVNVTPGTYSGGAAEPANIEWLLSTTDKKNYTITNNGRSAQLKYYTTHDKFGMYSYESSVITEFRLLPATFYTEAPMQVIEWKANSVVVMYTGSETTATTKVGNNDPSSSQTLANNKLTHGIYELTTDQALTSNDGAALEISFGDGSTRKIVKVPIIITGNRTATDGHAAQDVVICDGGKLTAETTSYDYYNIYVYGGGKLDIPTGTSLSVNNIILRAGGLSTSGIGSSPSATYQYVYPQVGLIGTLTSAEANIQYEYITDYDHWYHLCLPFDGTLNTIHYPMEYYGDNVAEDNTGSWIVKRYAGEIRATGNYNAWVDIETESATAVTAGHGYIFWGAPKKISVGGDTKQRSKWGIQRIAMPIANYSTAASAEAADKTVSSLSSYSGVSGNSGKNNDQGWNLIGNPYMVNLTGLNSTSIQVGQLVHTDTHPWDGKWEWDETDPAAGGLRYVTIPDNHFDNYEAKTMAWFTAENPMKAGRTFFVQIAGANTSVVFASAKRASLISAWKLAQEPAVDIETGIVLSNETMEDEVNFWLKDGKTEAYEYNADYPKMPNNTNLNIYGVHEHGDLSWIAISPEIAEGSMAIGYQVPAAGEYTLSLSETYISDKIDALYVTDHAMSPEVTVDLMDDPYVFTVMQAETNDTRFTVSIRLKEESPGTATDTEQIDTKSQQPQKFIYHEKMYILRGGVIYDATGKRVREINR